jgi:hypothetical protein
MLDFDHFQGEKGPYTVMPVSPSSTGVESEHMSKSFSIYNSEKRPKHVEKFSSPLDFFWGGGGRDAAFDGIRPHDYYLEGDGECLGPLPYRS